MPRKTIPFNFMEIPNPTIHDIKNYILHEYIEKGYGFKKFDLAEPIIFNLIKIHTQTLPNNASTLQRIITIIYDQPSCKMCDGAARWNRDKYGLYCSIKCRNNDSDYWDKIKQSKIDHFGENYTDIILEKSRATVLDRYGVNHYTEADDFIDKARATNLEKYGTDNYAKTDIAKKQSKEIMLKKYGVDSYTKTEEFKDKIKKTSLSHFGHEHPMKSDQIKEKVKKSINEKYGVDNYKQLDMPPISLNNLQNRQWLIDQHHENQKTLQSIALELNVNDTTVKRYITKHEINQKYYLKSDEQQEIENYMLLSNIEFNSNDKSFITPYEIDILIHDKKIAIEYCGLYWHSEIYKNDYYHKNKQIRCLEKGYKLITIFQDEWLYKKELVKNKLLHILNLNNSSKIFARKTKIINIDNNKKKQFFNKNHIQGNGPSSINYGLEYDNELVACIGFIKNKDGSFNLNRYATSCNVIGGFTKLLAHFEKEYNKPKIITFADLRWSEGDLYYNSGFIMDKELKPDYYYIIKDKRYHKFNFRHATGLKKLENYDPNLSEADNMLRHKIYKIYDCGKLRFIKN